MTIAPAPAAPAADAFDLVALYRDSGIGAIFEQLDGELIGLAPVKSRIREIAALLLVDKARQAQGLSAGAPSLHMCFTGNPGTGKTTVAMRMASILHRLGYIRQNHLVAVTRDDLVGQYIGHTAPKTKEVLKRAMGGVLFIDEAYYLYRPENERDYGQEAIEILLQVMENQRDDLVVILAGYRDRMESFFRSNPGMASRIAHHIDFPDYSVDELLQIAQLLSARMDYRFDAAGLEAMREYIGLRMRQPHFANARSIRNALDRARLRQANRLFAQAAGGAAAPDRAQLMVLAAEDIRASRVFRGGLAGAESPFPSPGEDMLHGRTTLSKFLIEQLKGSADASDLAALLVDVAAAIKAISAMAAKGALGGYLGATEGHNTHGEVQKTLDVLTNDAILRHCEWGGLVAGMASEEMERPFDIPPEYARGRYLLLFDPLDGSSNIDLNVAVGTIFSVLAHEGDAAPVEADYLQPGRRQVAAGYAIYGPSTVLVISVGRGTHGFTLDREIGNFVLTHPDLRILEETSEFAINTSNERFWEPPVQRYVEECKAGRTGPRGRDFNMRWIASMVAEVHRILVRGGVFMYPRDNKDPKKQGRLRLMYEANPMAMLVEQAGGAASTGRTRLLDDQPRELHQRVPVILGSKREVERIELYHREFDNGTDQPFASPLFNDRSLFRPEARG